jgi:hypothetical protein
MPVVPPYSRSKLKKLRKQYEQLEAEWDAKRAARVKPTRFEDDEFWSDRRDAFGPISEEIEYQLTAQLLAQARRYQVPIPAFVEEDGPWTEPQYISPYFLNEVARTELRSAIRKEQKERSEILRTWLTVVLSTIGAVCGVAALLLKK